jgi:hypothetical protein
MVSAMLLTFFLIVFGIYNARSVKRYEDTQEKLDPSAPDFLADLEEKSKGRGPAGRKGGGEQGSGKQEA